MSSLAVDRFTGRFIDLFKRFTVVHSMQYPIITRVVSHSEARFGAAAAALVAAAAAAVLAPGASEQVGGAHIAC